MNGDDEWAGTPFPYRVIICGVFIVAFVYLIMMPFYLYKGKLISEETITADVTIVDGTKHVKTPITMPYEIDIKYGSQYISYYTKDVNEYYKLKKQINHRCKAEMTILKYGTGDVRIEVEKLRIIPKKPTNMKQIRDYQIYITIYLAIWYSTIWYSKWYTMMIRFLESQNISIYHLCVEINFITMILIQTRYL